MIRYNYKQCLKRILHPLTTRPYMCPHMKPSYISYDIILNKHKHPSLIETFAFIPVTTCFDLARKTKPTRRAVFRIAQPHLINSARVTYVMFCSAQLLPRQLQILLFSASSSTSPALFSPVLFLLLLLRLLDL